MRRTGTAGILGRLMASALIAGLGCSSVHTDADRAEAERRADRDLRDSERAARRAEEGEGLAREIEGGVPPAETYDVGPP